MSPSGGDLIRALGAGIRPASISAGDAGVRPPNDPTSLSFASLLEGARSGEAATGLPVSIARGVGVSLGPEAMHELSAALDRAQAAGASKALVLSSEGTLEVDVLRRRVTGVLGPNDMQSRGGVLTGFDTVIRLTGAEDVGAGNEVMGPIGPGVHPSLLAALSEADDPTKTDRRAG
ncbi:MAG: hypothetical protein AAF747_00475 [Planctomycetota bacterium]